MPRAGYGDISLPANVLEEIDQYVTDIGTKWGLDSRAAVIKAAVKDFIERERARAELRRPPADEKTDKPKPAKK